MRSAVACRHDKWPSGSDPTTTHGPSSITQTRARRVVKTIVAGDIVVVVLIERNEVTVEGATDPQPWVLRTTQVFEQRGGTWVRLHRHADPLIDRRTPADTFAIARAGAAQPLR